MFDWFFIHFKKLTLKVNKIVWSKKVTQKSLKIA